MSTQHIYVHKRDLTLGIPSSLPNSSYVVAQDWLETYRGRMQGSNSVLLQYVSTSTTNESFLQNAKRQEKQGPIARIYSAITLKTWIGECYGYTDRSLELSCESCVFVVKHM